MPAVLSFINISGNRVPKGFKLSCVKLLKRIQKLTGKKFAEVSLVLVTSTKIKILNRQYRRINKVTDVLSFIYQVKPKISGEIFICLSKAKKQSLKFGNSFEQELEFLFVHGCLHLLGYDHIKHYDRLIMEKVEKKILGKDRLAVQNI